jgi:hypothetical protein
LKRLHVPIQVDLPTHFCLAAHAESPGAQPGGCRKRRPTSLGRTVAMAVAGWYGSAFGNRQQRMVPWKIVQRAPLGGAGGRASNAGGIKTTPQQRCRCEDASPAAGALQLPFDIIAVVVRALVGLDAFQHLWIGAVQDSAQDLLLNRFRTGDRFQHGAA